VIKTLTRHPRQGNLRWWKPWTCVRLIPGGAVNKVGLTNKGVDWWCDEVAPKIDFEKVKVIGSIYGSQSELWYMTEKLNRFPLVANEINVSCPNSGDKLQESQMIIQTAKKIKQISRHPLILKLSINQDYLKIAEELYGTVEAISFNSVPWETVFPYDKSPLWRLQKKVGGGGGGVSGQPIQTLNWQALEELHAQHLIPVIASSIMCYEDIFVVKALGAQAVSFATAHLPSHPVWLKPWTIFTNPCRPTSWVKQMAKPFDRGVITLMMTLLSFLFAVASVIPIFLPSLLAYVYGFNSRRDKARYGISIVHVLISAMIGGLVFLVISVFMLNAIMNLRSHPGILLFLAIAFVLNYVCCAIFYFLGTKQKLVTF
jgi:dihydroorotate dehydrogenase (NAD+) catalytic subunit